MTLARSDSDPETVSGKTISGHFIHALPPRHALRAPARCLLLTVAACKEEQAGVQVKDLSFTGNTAVTTAQLKSVLATVESPKLPWGPREYFSREEFEADLKRVVAFYRDRGYPDARVRSFDVRLSDDQKSVRLKIDIEEGEPIRVERVVITGLDPIPEEHRRELESRLPLKAGAPLDRCAAAGQPRGGARRAQGPRIPESGREGRGEPGSSDRLRVVTYSAEPGRLAYVGRIEVEGTASVNDRIVRRQLTFRPGQLFQQSKLRESQRRLYSMELFNFVNVEAVTDVDIATASAETVGPENARRPDTDPRDRHRRKASQGQLRRRLRDRREGARRNRLAARELLRRGAHGRGLRQLLGDRPRRPPQLPAAVLLQPAVLLRVERAVVVQRRAGVRAHDDWRPGHHRARVHAFQVGPRRAADDDARA